MGYSNWTRDADEHLTSSYSTRSRDDIFTSNIKSKTHDDLSPNGVIFRESRDSVDHPESLAVAVFLDVTGSMGRIPEILIRTKLGTLMNSLVDHGLKDAQLMFGAIGDHITDKSSLQVGQFETGADELHNCLGKIYIEGGGGGQNRESYLLAWLFASRHTTIDCFEKRNQKGILFTIGDEKSWDKLDSDDLKKIMGYGQADNVTDKELLEEARRSYHVFHIHVNEGMYKNNPEIISYWKTLLGERVIIVDDHNEIAEIIASTVGVMHGLDLNALTSSFDKRIAKNVKNALAKVDLSVSKTKGNVINL